MKTFFSIFLGLCVVSFVPKAMAQADEQVTLTTYFPAPVGVYHELRSDTVKYSSQTAYPCTCDSTPGNASCKGTMFFGTVNSLESLYFCTGTEWTPLYDAPSDAYYLGGYFITGPTGIYNGAGATAYYVTPPGGTAGNTALSSTNLDNPQSPPCVQIWSPTSGGRAIKVNFKGLSRGNYVFEWSGTLDVDQISGTNDKEVRLLIQAWNGYGWANIGSSENVYDYNHASSNNFTIPNPAAPAAPIYAEAQDISGSCTIYYGSYSMTNNVYREYRMALYKSANGSVQIARLNDPKLEIRRFIDN